MALWVSVPLRMLVPGTLRTEDRRLRGETAPRVRSSTYEEAHRASWLRSMAPGDRTTATGPQYSRFASRLRATGAGSVSCDHTQGTQAGQSPTGGSDRSARRGHLQAAFFREQFMTR